MILQLYNELYPFVDGYFNMKLSHDRNANGEIYGTLNVYPMHSPFVCMSFMDNAGKRYVRVWLGASSHNLGSVHHIWISRDADDDVPRVIKVFTHDGAVVTVRMHEGKAKITLNMKEEFTCQ